MGNLNYMFFYMYNFFRVHCFNANHSHLENKQCPDLEISYLVHCQNSPESRLVQLRKRYENFKISCKAQPHVTHFFPETTTSITSTGKIPSLFYLYLLTTLLGLWILNVMWRINHHLRWSYRLYPTFHSDKRVYKEYLDIGRNRYRALLKMILILN